jgi:hypothetical protein
MKKNPAVRRKNPGTAGFYVIGECVTGDRKGKERKGKERQR